MIGFYMSPPVHRGGNAHMQMLSGMGRSARQEGREGENAVRDLRSGVPGESLAGLQTCTRSASAATSARASAMRSAPLTTSSVFRPAGAAVASAASPSLICGAVLSCDSPHVMWVSYDTDTSAAALLTVRRACSSLLHLLSWKGALL